MLSSLSPFRPLHNLFCHLSPSFSPSRFMLFSIQLSLLSLSLSRSIFPFSVLLRADFPMRCRRGGTRIREGITEKTSPVPNDFLAMLLPNFYNIFTTGSLEVMNEKWQYSKPWPLPNRLVRAVHKQFKPPANTEVLERLVFLLLWSKALINTLREENWDFIFWIYLI